MRTFLASFCAPGGPLAKAVGIFLEKQPLPGDHYPPWEFQKVTSLKILSLRGNFLKFPSGVVVPREGLFFGKSRRDFL